MKKFWKEWLLKIIFLFIGLTIALSDKLHIKFSIMRIVTDGLFVLIGFLLGGNVGIGTLVCVFLIGPVAGIFLPINGRIIQKITGQNL